MKVYRKTGKSSSNRWLWRCGPSTLVHKHQLFNQIKTKSNSKSLHELRSSHQRQRNFKLERRPKNVQEDEWRYEKTALSITNQRKANSRKTYQDIPSDADDSKHRKCLNGTLTLQFEDFRIGKRKQEPEEWEWWAEENVWSATELECCPSKLNRNT